MSAWFTKIFCPVVGLIITNCMWVSPLPTILKVRAQKTFYMKDVNPTPFTFMVLNCIGWIIYGLMIQNLYLFFANVTGVLFGMFYLLSVMMTCVRQQKLADVVSTRYCQLERQLIVSIGLWMILALIATSHYSHRVVHVHNEKLQTLLIGNAVMLFNVAYYAAPFSTLYEVIKSRDSTSILAVMVAVNLLDATLWLVYAIAIDDYYLMVPNALGVLLAVSQLLVRLLFCGKSQPYKELDVNQAAYFEDPLCSSSAPVSTAVITSTAFVDSTTVTVLPQASHKSQYQPVQVTSEWRV